MSKREQSPSFRPAVQTSAPDKTNIRRHLTKLAAEATHVVRKALCAPTCMPGSNPGMTAARLAHTPHGERR